MKSLKGKVALVTGASRGLGRGIAKSLAKYGTHVIVNYFSSEDEAIKVVEMLKSYGSNTNLFKADVGSVNEVKEMFNYIKKDYGVLDILVNNAGTSQSKDIFDLEYQEWKWMIDNNLSSGFYCSKIAMEMMRKKNYGRIIFISSVVGQQGAIHGHVHYAATKSGQLGMVKTLARTGAKYNITVNAVAPGIIETELLQKIHGEEGVKSLAASVPLGLGEVDDIGESVAFLCSDSAKYITGATLDVNGGMYLR